jgi:hypothetical protein
LTELLVREFTADEPRLLARPERMLQEEPISLSEADEDTDDDSDLFI